jgi:hypothetical protein
MTADPKPAARIVDPGAMTRKRRADPWCRACMKMATNCHHLIGKGHRGDDVEANLIPICGSGSNLCHGALHGTPYTDLRGRRWTGEDVRRGIGRYLAVDELRYVITKLGSEDAAAEFLRRHYFLEVVSFAPFVGAAA